MSLAHHWSLEISAATFEDGALHHSLFVVVVRAPVQGAERGRALDLGAETGLAAGSLVFACGLGFTGGFDARYALLEQEAPPEARKASVYSSSLSTPKKPGPASSSSSLKIKESSCKLSFLLLSPPCALLTEPSCSESERPRCPTALMGDPARRPEFFSGVVLRMLADQSGGRGAPERLFVLGAAGSAL